MLEDEADKDVVDGYGDGIDTHGSHGGAQAHLQEDVEEDHLQQVVDDVGCTKACAVLDVGLRTEDVAGAHVIVEHKAGDIACRPGDVDINDQLEQPVDGIMDGGDQHTHDGEAYHFAQGLAIKGDPKQLLTGHFDYLLYAAGTRIDVNGEAVGL